MKSSSNAGQQSKDGLGESVRAKEERERRERPPTTRELEAEDLILVLPETAAPNAAHETLAATEPIDSRLPFVNPTLTKFTDMQDLLLLDPIHEVDEMGWPHPKPAPEAASKTARQPLLLPSTTSNTPQAARDSSR